MALGRRSASRRPSPFRNPAAMTFDVPTHVSPAGHLRALPGALLAAHRDFLLRVARLQLGRDEDAHDAVQETLAAALAQPTRIADGVPLRAWLLAILRHKIVDALRLRTRYVHLDPADDLEPPGAEFDRLFEENGCWRPDALGGGACPQGAAVHAQLLAIVKLCVQKLPANTARVFLMREFLGMEFDEIASELSLSPGNLRVLLYRARMRLRECVSRGWGDC